MSCLGKQPSNRIKELSIGTFLKVLFICSQTFSDGRFLTNLFQNESTFVVAVARVVPDNHEEL